MPVTLPSPTTVMGCCDIVHWAEGGDEKESAAVRLRTDRQFGATHVRHYPVKDIHE